MTEQEWRLTNDPVSMLRFVFRESEGEDVVLQSRKSRFYLVACCRRVWNELPWASKVTTEFVERSADGALANERLAKQFLCVAPEHGFSPEHAMNYVVEGVQLSAEFAHEAKNSENWRTHIGHIGDYEKRLAELGYEKPAIPDYRPTSPNELERFAAVAKLAYLCHWGSDNVPYDAVPNELQSVEILRDIAGNPFRPITVNRDWLTWNDRTVPKLAQTIYDDRRFDLLPILADALEEAGCGDADILAHCRGPGPHVRGCWVVDLLLGKT